jgi:hypothetical protein
MSALGPRMNRALLAGCVALAMGACSTDLGGPDGARVQERPQAGPALTESASELSIVDSDGTQYTLSIPDREIRMSDGRILGLTAEQTTEAAEAFYATMATDPVAQDVQTLSYTPYDPNCPDPTKVCGEERNVIPLGTSTAPPRILIRRPSSSRMDEPINRRHPQSKSRARAYKDRASNSIRVFSFAQYGGTANDACTNVVNNAVTTTSAYFNKRTSIIKEVWPSAVAEVGNALKKTIPYGTAIATQFAAIVAEHRALVVNVNVLAFVWNSYNCSNRTVTAGPIFQAGGGGGGGGYTCESQHWSISFDNGSTWHGIWVTVCYMMD